MRKLRSFRLLRQGAVAPALIIRLEVSFILKITAVEGLGISEQKVHELASSLSAHGAEFVYYPDRPSSDAEIIRRGADSDAIIITNLPISAAAIAGMKKLKLISVAFIGIDHIDADAARERGIVISNARGYCDASVCELVFGLVFGLLRRIPRCDDAVRSGRDRAGLVGNELCGKTFGIVGTGALGTRVASAAKAFGCNVIACSRTEKPELAGLLKYVGLEKLMSESDIVSLHVPLNGGTRGLISAELIGLMKPSALLINTARGPVIDSAALASALNSGRIAGAGCDVFDTEPPLSQNNPLLTAKNTILTPHVGFATEEAAVRRAGIVIENVRAWLDGNPQNVISY